jgi:hypothetical protein
VYHKKATACELIKSGVSRQRESKMKKATYEQLVKVAVEYANNNNCSYAIAAKLYKVAKGDVLAFQGAVR